MLQCVGLKPLRLGRAWVGPSEDRLPGRVRRMRRPCLVLLKTDLRPIGVNVSEKHDQAGPKAGKIALFPPPFCVLIGFVHLNTNEIIKTP
jgi:hypothetical protein